MYIDALRNASGQADIFPHNDMKSCEKQFGASDQLRNETGGRNSSHSHCEGVCFGMTRKSQGKLKES